MDSGDRDAAAASWRTLSQRYPEDARVQTEYAKWLRDFGSADAALQAWADVERLVSDDPLARLESQLERAKLLSKLGKQSAALALFDTCLAQVRPDSWAEDTIWTELRGHFQQDIQGYGGYLQSHIQRHPDNLRAVLELSVVLEKKTEREEARRMLEAALARAPSHVGLHRRIIELARNGGDTASALRHFERLHEILPQDVDVLVDWGSAIWDSRAIEIEGTDEDAESQQQYQDLANRALAVWERIPAIDPDDPRFYLRAATVVVQASGTSAESGAPIRSSVSPPGKKLFLNAAERLLRDALQRAYASETHAALRGDCCQQLAAFLNATGRRTEAIQVWEQYATEANSPDVWLDMTRTLRDWDEKDQAIAAVERALLASPERLDALELAAHLHLQVSHWADAQAYVERWERASTTPRQLVEALHLRVELLSKTRELTSEIIALSNRLSIHEAEKTWPDNAWRDLWLLAICCEADNRLDDAEDAYRAASQLLPKDVPLWVARAECNVRRKSWPTAIDCYGHLAALVPAQRTHYLAQVVHLELRRGNREEAEQAAELLIREPARTTSDYIARAAVARELGNAQAALEQRRQACRLEPTNLELRRDLAANLVQYSVTLTADRAASLSREALELYWSCFLDERDTERRRDVIRLLTPIAVADGRVDEVNERIRALGNWPQRERWLFEAEVQIASKQHDRALATLRKLLELDPDDVSTLNIYFVTASSVNDVDARLDALERLSLLTGDEIYVAMLLGIYMRDANRFDDALRLARQLAERHQRSDLFVSLASHYLVAESRPELSLTCVHAGLELFPEDRGLNYWACLLEPDTEKRQTGLTRTLSLCLQDPELAASAKKRIETTMLPAPPIPLLQSGLSISQSTNLYRSLRPNVALVFDTSVSPLTRFPELVAERMSAETTQLLFERAVRVRVSGQRSLASRNQSQAALSTQLRVAKQVDPFTNALMCLHVLGFDDGMRQLEQISSDYPDQAWIVGRMKLLLAATHPAGSPDWQLMNSYQTQAPEDPLPHLLHLHLPPPADSEYSRADYFHALDTSRRWLVRHQPEGANAYYYAHVTRLIEVDATEEAVAALRDGIRDARSLTDLLTLLDFVSSFNRTELRLILLQKCHDVAAIDGESGRLALDRMLLYLTTTAVQTMSDDEWSLACALLVHRLKLPPQRLVVSTATRRGTPEPVDPDLRREIVALLGQYENIRRDDEGAFAQAVAKELEANLRQLRTLGRTSTSEASTSAQRPRPFTFGLFTRSLDSDQRFVLNRVLRWAGEQSSDRVLRTLGALSDDGRGDRPPNLRVASALALWQSGQYDASLAEWEALRDDYLGSGEFALSVAVAYLHAGRIAEAFGLLIDDQRYANTNVQSEQLEMKDELFAALLTDTNVSEAISCLQHALVHRNMNALAVFFRGSTAETQVDSERPIDQRADVAGIERDDLRDPRCPALVTRLVDEAWQRDLGAARGGSAGSGLATLRNQAQLALKDVPSSYLRALLVLIDLRERNEAAVRAELATWLDELTRGNVREAASDAERLLAFTLALRPEYADEADRLATQYVMASVINRTGNRSREFWEKYSRLIGDSADRESEFRDRFVRQAHDVIQRAPPEGTRSDADRRPTDRPTQRECLTAAIEGLNLSDSNDVGGLVDSMSRLMANQPEANVDAGRLGAVLESLWRRARELPVGDETLIGGLLGMVFPSGEGEQPRILIWSADESHRLTKHSAAEWLIEVAAQTERLARLQQQWADHPQADSMPMLVLRTEAAHALGAKQEVEQLLVRLDSQRSPSPPLDLPLWSVTLLARIDHERVAAQWLLEHGSRVWVDAEQRVTRADHLPAEPFQLTQIEILGRPYKDPALGRLMPRITDADVALLRGLPHLKKITLLDSGVTDTGLTQLLDNPKLRQIVIEKTSITDAIIPKLAAIDQLETISLEKTDMTRAGVEQLQRSLPNCVISWDGE
ncbi:MAG: hypothetical protein KDA60_06805 [Planctomycetales bacterium]|nr:hypothetical protein [Planctomycetales bacterium]